MEKTLRPIRATYFHPASAKQLTDTVLDIDYAKQTLTVDRYRPQSTESLELAFSEVVSFEFPSGPAADPRTGLR